MAVDFDPHLRQLLLKASERQPLAAHRQCVGVIARLRTPEAEIPGLQVVVRAGPVVTGRVYVDAVTEVRQHPDVLSLKRTHHYLPHDVLVHGVPASVHGLSGGVAAQDTESAAAPPWPWTGRGVVVGMLDWGFDVAHADFVRPSGGTRFLALWDQRGGRTPLSPPAYGYGRVFDARAVDHALTQPDPYAALGYDPAEIDPYGQGTHGTHTLGIACGNGRSGAPRSMAPDSSVLAVHLRADDTSPHDTLADSVRFLEGVDWIFRAAGDQPVVLSMSLGRGGGPHDSTPLVVQALDALLEVPGRQIVCSAGNYFGTAQHCSAQLTEGTAVEWGWSVEPPVAGDAEMEIWYPAADDLTVELLAPDGTVVARLPPGAERIVQDGDRIVFSGFHRRTDPGSGDHVVDLFLWPGAPQGVWRVRLLPGRIERGEVHGWIERVHRGRQSRFTAPDQLFTTNTLCNGRRTLAVAAYDHRAPNEPPGAFSSAGPARDLRLKPDLAAPGVAITAARSSVLVNGRRERDGVTTMTGTSMAAPHVASAVAVLFEAAGRLLHSDEVTHLLRSTARPSLAGRERVGHGRLDISAALARLAEL
ncbi:S8 family serine peptidase [Streptomyces sp. NPDC056948]|uniref:S8 family serine peptidase n=1 Tax=Streptomyces sp. NPDC056948 TaxID=3345975 RepID=UPI00362D0891